MVWRRGREKAGVSLVELVLAVSILAVAFLPIIGVMSSSIRGTTKDDRLVRAMHLAQAMMNAALQFPFDDIVANNPGHALATGAWGFGPASFSYTHPASNLTLTLGPEPQGVFTTALRIDSETVRFDYWTYDPIAREVNSSTPSLWGWQRHNDDVDWSGAQSLFHRYTLTVTWSDAHGTSPLVYRLVGFKANLQE